MQSTSKDPRTVFICPSCGGPTRMFRGEIFGAFAEGEWCKACGPKSIMMTPAQRAAYDKKLAAQDPSPN